MMAMSPEERDTLKTIEISVAKFGEKLDNLLEKIPDREMCSKNRTRIELLGSAISAHFWWLCGLTVATISVVLYVLTGKIVIP